MKRRAGGGVKTACWVWIAAVAFASAATVPGNDVPLNTDPPGPRQVEPMVTIDPNSPVHLVAVAEESVDRNPDSTVVRVWVSRDAGQSWEDAGLLPGQAAQQTNPSVSYCKDGTVWAALNDLGANAAFRVYRSLDGGSTWEERTPARPPANSQDLPLLTCDDSNSAFQGRLYVRYVSTGRILVVRSDDQAETWSDPVRVDAGGAFTSNFPGETAIGPDGEVWIGFVKNTTPLEIRTVTSYDGGVTWQPPQTVGPVDLVNAAPYDYRRSSRPSLAVDRSDGAFRGGVHLVFGNDFGGQSDVMYSRRLPGPGSWSPTSVLEDVPAGSDQDFPLIRVDADGVVSALWFDHRNDPGDQSIEVWGVISRDFGSSFEANFQISQTSFIAPTGAGAFLGDHLAHVTWSNVFLGAWPDRQRDDGDLLASAVRLFMLDPVSGVRVDKNGTATTISWDSQDLLYGEATVYDVSDGALTELRSDGGFERAACAASDVPDTPWEDGRSGPSSGEGRYYLVRSRLDTDRASWGASSTLVDHRLRLDVASPCP